jgi:hypothetical protein
MMAGLNYSIAKAWNMMGKQKAGSIDSFKRAAKRSTRRSPAVVKKIMFHYSDYRRRSSFRSPTNTVSAESKH